MRGGGNRTTQRKILLEIIADRLVVHIGDPPTQHRSRREAIFDLFLNSDASMNEHCKVPTQKREIQKCILGHFFPGDIQNEDIVEYCASEPTPKQVAVPMLLPAVFARSR